MISVKERFLSDQSFKLINAVPEFAPVPSVKISKPAVVETEATSSIFEASF